MLVHLSLRGKNRACCPFCFILSYEVIKRFFKYCNRQIVFTFTILTYIRQPTNIKYKITNPFRLDFMSLSKPSTRRVTVQVTCSESVEMHCRTCATKLSLCTCAATVSACSTNRTVSSKIWKIETRLGRGNHWINVNATSKTKCFTFVSYILKEYEIPLTLVLETIPSSALSSNLRKDIVFGRGWLITSHFIPSNSRVVSISVPENLMHLDFFSIIMTYTYYNSFKS